jgi:RimJ/RimL family protein N-acetyltransferase
MRGELITARLRMRRWRGDDEESFAALNADPRVMEFFPSTLSRIQSDELISQIEAHFEQHGYGLWALEHSTGGEFVGFTGLSRVTFAAHFTPAVEVGWRLAHEAWGHGYATEAARGALAFGFREAGLEEIISMTSAQNLRSRAVMRRVGMSHSPVEDFAHPQLPVTSGLSRHVLYRISATDWFGRAATLAPR